MSEQPDISTMFSSSLPERIKVGPITYSVTMQDCPVAPHEGGEVPVYGMINFKRSEITIDSDLAPMMQWQCFWHEVFHIIFEQLGMNNDDEGATDAFAYKFLEILVDNKFLRFPALETEGNLIPTPGYSPFSISLAHGE